MDNAREAFGEIILDANSLIDFYCEEPMLIRLVNEHIGRILVPRDSIINQSKLFALPECKNLGLTITSSSMDIIFGARNRIAGMSFQDMICFLEAKERKIPIYTNESKFHNFSKTKRVNADWSYNLLVDLCKKGQIEKNVVFKHVKNIYEKTPIAVAKVMSEIRKQI